MIVNHQLVPNVVYPGGANDMQLAREWIYNNITSENFGCGSPEKVLLFGHSSGGAHVAMNLYAGGKLDQSFSNILMLRMAKVTLFSHQSLGLYI